MILLPPAFICVVIAFSVEVAQFEYFKMNSMMFQKANPYGGISDALFKTIEILGPTTNIISCLILVLVIRHIYRISQQVEMSRDIVTAKNKVNVLVISSHIGVTLAYTISQFVSLFYKNMTQNYRM
jgi:hypothetical protein